MSSERVEAFEAILKDLRGVEPAVAKERFTALFERGCLLLELDDAELARAFGTSRSNTSRWRRGKVVPPAASLILKHLHGLVVERLAKVRKLYEARGCSSGASFGSFPMAALGR